MEIGPKKEPPTSLNGASADRNGNDSTQNLSWQETSPENKRRKCVSTACIACRRRKSKCDGAQPACAACVSVYNTECIYDPASDHRRKGVYKKDIDNLKTRNSTLQTLIHGILNYPEEEVPDLVARIRSCDSLDKVAESIVVRNNADEAADKLADSHTGVDGDSIDPNPTFESRLANKIGELRLGDSEGRMVGGTSNLWYLEGDSSPDDSIAAQLDSYRNPGDPITSWTNVSSDPQLIMHLLNHYFTWHYTFFTILPKEAFYKQFYLGRTPVGTHRKNEFCTSLLVNAMLAIGCHFTSTPGSRATPDDSATAGDHFFQEAQRQLYEDDELTTPRLTTVQALALMSVREAGCGREFKGWVYSGLSFRMGCDLGMSFQLNVPSALIHSQKSSNEEEEDAKRITFWGCFMIDKCWSQYLGRLPIFQLSTNVTIPKFEVFPNEESSKWSPYYDSGFSEANIQPSRVRTIALQISTICEISSDLISNFYHPQQFDKPPSRRQELKNLSDIHSRLEQWRRELPSELEPREGTLSSVFVMHMMFQLLYIHLFRPFLKYSENTLPLAQNVSPRKMCTQAAGAISKLFRLYKRSHGLRQIVNIAVYICHSACTIHLLNLPEKSAARDITHGVKHLEEIAEGWLCARRTLRVLSAQARNWNIKLPEHAESVLSRTDKKYGSVGIGPGQTTDESGLPRSSNPVPNTNDQTNPSYPNSSYAYSDSNSILSNTDMSHQVSIQEWQFSFPYTSETTSNIQANSAPPQQATSSLNSESKSILPVEPSSYLSIQPPVDWHQVPRQSRSPVSSHQATSRASSAGSRKRKEADMFGGVEALLREGQDWSMKSQVKVPPEFDKWIYGNITRPANHHQEPAGQQNANFKEETDPTQFAGNLDINASNGNQLVQSSLNVNNRITNVEDIIQPEIIDYSKISYLNNGIDVSSTASDPRGTYAFGNILNNVAASYE